MAWSLGVINSTPDIRWLVKVGFFGRHFADLCFFVARSRFGARFNTNAMQKGGILRKHAKGSPRVFPSPPSALPPLPFLFPSTVRQNVEHAVTRSGIAICGNECVANAHTSASSKLGGYTITMRVALVTSAAR